jgi:hypothetical protein
VIDMMSNSYDDAFEFFASGDARRCPRHPHIKTSSDDGMHDAPCGACEAAMSDDDEFTDTCRARNPMIVSWWVRTADRHGASCEHGLDDGLDF